VRSLAGLLLLLTTACSFAHEYRSGEVPRLQLYGQELSSVLRPCEWVFGDLRRDAKGERLFLRTAVAEGPGCSIPLSNYVLTLQSNKPPTRVAVPLSGPSEGAVVTDDGIVLGKERIEGKKVFFDFAGGPTIDGDVEVHRDKSGAPYYSAAHDPGGTEIAPLNLPRRVVARSSLRGPLFSRGSRHYACGWIYQGDGTGACDVFDSDDLGGDWRATGRLLFGDHWVVDMDPASRLVLVASHRDDLDPLLFTVDLGTWEWRYIGSGPAQALLFMNVDPLGRDQSRRQ
jgi:hypothetical protein